MLLNNLECFEDAFISRGNNILDIDGRKYLDDNINSATDCQPQCQNYNACDYFNFDKIDKKCYLKTSNAAHNKKAGWGYIFVPKNCPGSVNGML